ncbi:MAG: ABC transporter ATP-binding protein [Solirubrobacteraceae bacterium]|jgi:branched-chain amino acid transport system ATP-binding protein
MSALAAPVSADTAVLELRDLVAGYGDAEVLHAINITVRERSIVTLLGPNGAGKTTVMRVVSGTLRPSSGQVRVRAADVTALSPQQRSRRGVCLIPEGRGIFRSLTVRDNLELFRPAWVHPAGLDHVTEVFPILGDRLNQTAGTLSGGEQQMLALARAFLCEPSIVLVDEVSMGLAPKLVDQIFEILVAIANHGVSVLLVEQYVSRALELADHAYVLSRGQIVLEGTTDEVRYADVASSYLA